jgi:nucleotide-binding universal stress UspA family protein
MKRILLGVDDSPAGVAAARTAVELAAECAAELRAVYVATDGELARALQARPGGGHTRLDLPHRSAAVLRFVADIAKHADVPVQVVAVQGQPARCVLDQADTWSADLIVLGRSTGHRLGQPYIGSQAQHVMEFAEVPVLVVPPPQRHLP